MLNQEFDCQVENLLQKGYPEAAGLSAEEFLKHIKLLKDRVGELEQSEIDLERGRLPFVIVVKSDLVAIEKAMSLIGVKVNKG